VREWAGREAAARPEIVRIGYIGSYATGDWGVGSDVDLVVVVDRCDLPMMERGRHWDTTRLPVPADLLVYTIEETDALENTSPRFSRTLDEEAVWVYQRSVPAACE
jgi:predicted nucleotidyltransferase